MTHDIYFVKTRTNKQKQTDALLYVNDGCGLNNCYSIKCNKQQEKYLCFTSEDMHFRRRRQKIESDRIGSQIGSQKVKKNQKHQIVYELVVKQKIKVENQSMLNENKKCGLPLQAKSLSSKKFK